MLKNFRDKSYQMDSLKRLYFIKKVQKNKKPKKIILSFIIYILSKVWKNYKIAQELNVEQTKLQVEKLIRRNK